MKESRSGVGILIMILLVGGLGGLIAFRLMNKGNKTAVSIEDVERAEGVAIEVERLVRSDFEDVLVCDGKIAAGQDYILRASVDGIVEAVHVDIGDIVEEGQLLAEFRKTDLEANVSAGQAVYDEAKLNYERFTKLLEKGGVSQSDVDARKTALENSSALLEWAKSRLGFAEVRCPIGGKDGKLQVSQRFVEPGERKGMDKELLHLVDLSNVKVRISVPESIVSSIKKGQTMEFRLENDTEWRTGPVERISPSTTHPNRFFDVFVLVENENPDSSWLLRPGMYAEARVSVGVVKNAIAVSAGAVKRKSGKEFLFLAEETDGELTARWIEVGTGLRSDGYIQLIGDSIKDGDMVISNPRDSLNDGDKVRIMEN